MKPYSLKSQEVIENFSSNLDQGLSSERAEELLKEFGENKIERGKKRSVFTKFLLQFKDAMIIILIIAALVSLAAALHEGDPREFFEPCLIMLIVIVNAIMGVAQESKAEKALEELQNTSVPHARVVRDGKESVIDARKVVPGDIISLEAGDVVPADARVISSSSLKSEESALTGESVPSEKRADAELPEDAPIGDRINMVYSGCPVSYGKGRALVTATGTDTEIGKISKLLSGYEDSTTPLQNKLSALGKKLGLLALAACAVIFVVGMMDGIPLKEIFMTSVSLAVSAIPEGLPAIVTIVLALGVQRMVKKNAVIRRLPAVETLGGASVICSDKTGTLTRNVMTLVEAYTDKSKKRESLKTGASNAAVDVLKLACLCSDGSVKFLTGGKEVRTGDPTETAIISAAHKNGVEKELLDSSYKRIYELPFDSDRKMMTTVTDIDGKKLVVVKGAFEEVSKRCVKGDLQRAKEENEKASEKALRVIAVAYKEIDKVPENADSEALENGLTFAGLLGMIDPPRFGAKESVRTCLEAGIKPVMITGDHVATASAIARELGILSEGDEALAGKEVSAMTDEELSERVENVSVYARVSPEDKIRIVKAWKSRGEVVAMTGDGVNDAPALKAADVGCAMGRTGTDVAKGAADMILTDDNFSTIVHAVKEGRGVYDNVKKVIGFLLGTNIGEVLSVFFAMLFWKQTPLISTQLLWINLVTDGLPAIALGTEEMEPDITSRKPRPKNEGIFAGGMGVRVILQGIMFAALTLIGFYIGGVESGSLAGGQTAAFLALATSQVFQAFNARSSRPLFKIGPFGNKNLNMAALISLAMIALAAFTPIQTAFGMIYLPRVVYLWVFGLSLVPIFISEIAKAIRARKSG